MRVCARVFGYLGYPAMGRLLLLFVYACMCVCVCVCLSGYRGYPDMGYNYGFRGYLEFSHFRSLPEKWSTCCVSIGFNSSIERPRGA